MTVQAIQVAPSKLGIFLMKAVSPRLLSTSSALAALGGFTVGDSTPTRVQLVIRLVSQLGRSWDQVGIEFG